MNQTTIEFRHGTAPWYEFPAAQTARLNAHFAPANGIPAASYGEFLHGLKNVIHCTAMDPLSAWTAPPDRAVSWSEHAQILSTAIHSQYGAPIVGIGHSFGATCTLLAACEQPELFSRLVLIEPASTPNFGSYITVRASPMWVKRKMFPFINGSYHRRRIWASREQFYEYYRGHPTFSRFTDRALRDYAKFGLTERPDGQLELLIHPHWEANIFSNVGFIWSALRRLEVPTLLLKAEHTYLYTQDYFDRQSAKLGSHIEARTVADAGHLMTHEIPKRLSQIIEHWLR
ncbi:MAG: alpha/beta hydrolase [Gammaproteobacteria bacterium]|nr:alpha/beta hydrolase [Gammaproteobacteria bacterium]